MNVATAETEISEAPATYAGVGGRFVALFLDGLAMIGFFILLGGVFVTLFGGRTEGGFEFTGIVGGLFIAVEIVLVMGYFVVSEARWGATLGKLAAGMRVQSTAGSRIGYGASFIRNLLRIIDILPAFYLVGAISVWITRRNQRVGDLVAGSVVVREESGGGPRAAALAGVLVVAVGGVLLGMILMQLAAGRQAEISGSVPDAVAPQSAAAVSESGSMESAGTTPWSGRGWVPGDNDTFTNLEHGLKVVVPDGWIIVDDLDDRYLWMMAMPGIPDDTRAHQFYFVRDGLGYVVSRNASADASAEDVADLETIRQSMGLL